MGSYPQFVSSGQVPIGRCPSPHRAPEEATYSHSALHLLSPTNHNMLAEYAPPPTLGVELGYISRLKAPVLVNPSQKMPLVSESIVGLPIDSHPLYTIEGIFYL